VVAQALQNPDISVIPHLTLSAVRMDSIGEHDRVAASKPKALGMAWAEGTSLFGFELALFSRRLKA